MSRPTISSTRASSAAAIRATERLPMFGRRRNLTVAFLLALTTAATATADVVIRRDGVRETGVLKSCTDERCQWAGQAVPRAEIGWISFGEAGAPPTPQDPLRDQVWLRDGRTAVGEVLGLSLGSVATEDDSFDRPDVTWIYFGSAEGLPRLQQASPAENPATTSPQSQMTPATAADSNTQEPPASVAASTVLSAKATAVAPAEKPAKLYLNEVSVLPQKGRSAFVELSNGGSEPVSLSGVSLRNERGAVCRLPKGVTVPASSLYVVLFDGAAGGGGAHCPTGILNKVGSVELQATGARWDLLDWGETPFGFALRTRGGRISDLVPGTSLGRPPLSPGVGSSPWVRYSRSQVTPGEINPLPAVDSFMALAGAIFERREVPLTWYAVGGAERYRVQVSATPDFSAMVLDRTIDNSAGRANETMKVITDPLSAGRYFWRVQALGAGAEAPFSESQSFEVRVEESASARPAEADRGKSGAPETPAPSTPSATEEILLPVPYIGQNKDTWLLALEADAEDPDPKPWDRPWQTQPPYCARASIAMVNAYYRAKLNVPGKLSQDRITYEVYHDRTLHEGPEVDIYVDAGFNAPMIAKALEFALGAPASRRFLVPVAAWEEYVRNVSTTGMFIWETVENELKEGRPIVGTSECHAWVFAGYRRVEGWLELRVLDPAMGSYWFRPGEFRELTGGGDEPAGTTLAETFFLPKLDEAQPASDEPSIEPDSDNDGVRDFDEEVRFKTGVLDDDSDDDGVRDKEEIRASVFEPPQGWSIKTRNILAGQFFPRPSDTGRDFDGDGKMMERDPDSDNGGCEDGEEDLNGNGKTDPGETSNFDKSDDPTAEDGTCGVWTGTVETRMRTRQEGNSIDWHIVEQVRLREVNFIPLFDPGPEHGGREAGARMGSLVDLECAGTTVEESWRQETWNEVGYRQICTASGAKTIQAGSGTDGFLRRKSADFDLTPVLGFDVPTGGGFYTFRCHPGSDLDLAVSCVCSGAACRGPHSELSGWVGPATIGGAPDPPRQACGDPEVRFLAGGGNQMTGTYSRGQEPGDCVPRHLAVSWSLCRVGTPCAPLPPMPALPDERR